MDVRYFRKSRSTFYETHDGGRRPATLEAAVGLAQEGRHDLEDVPLQIRRLAALGVPPSFRAATAKLVIVALPLPVVGLHPGVHAEESILLSRPTAKNLQVQMAQRPDAVEIQQRPEIPAFGPRPFIRREGADRTVLEVGVSWPDPPGLGAGGPETPSAGSHARPVRKSYEKCGLPRQTRDDRASREKPQPFRGRLIRLGEVSEAVRPDAAPG
jgi:hypothetical protein